jgi:hypothetical protein
LIPMVQYLKIPWNRDFWWKRDLFLYNRRNWEDILPLNVDFLWLMVLPK